MTTGPALPTATTGSVRPRRILLVTGSLGAGHHAAARAVEERARVLWPGVEVTWTDTLDGMGPGTGKLFAAVYATCTRRLPLLYELYFRLLWHVRPFRAGTRAVIGAWSGRGVSRQIAAHRPDLVVATFPEGITGLGWLRRRGRLPVPAVALVADPAPHPLWADAALDLHLVTTSAAARMLQRAAPGAAAKVTALPVVSSFAPPPPGPARERALVYVSCGSLAFGDVPAACAAVLDAGADVLVSAGRNTGVRARLDRVASSHPLGARMRVVDWVDDPAAATRECDVVVTNAGGATALEALACARPLLLFAPIPGHGRANAALLADAGLARICPAPADLAAEVAALTDPARRAAVSRRLRDRFAGTDLASDLATLGDLAPPVAASGPRLRAQDALFLHAATPAVPQQVGTRIVLAPGAADDLPAHLAELIRTRVPDIELLNRRLARPRPGHALRWRTDGADPRRHLRARVVEIGPEGDHQTWDDAVTAFFADPVDPFTTGWELQIARECPAGRAGVLAKVHHVLGDGLAVTDALVRLLADECGAGAVPAPVRARAARRNRAREAFTVVRGIGSLALAGAAGGSPLTGPIVDPAHRRMSVLLDGARVRAAARAHGVGTTVLLLAVVAETLHGVLAERGHAPAGVRAMVPLTTRTSPDVDSRTPGNRTAAVSVELPTGAMPPAERVTRVASALADGASAGQPEGAAAVLTLLGLLPGRLQALLVRRIYGHRFFHLLASVMPGVRRKLHVRGMPMVEVHPVLPLADGVGLAIGAMHWGRTTAIGITGDVRLLREIEGIPDRIKASLALVSQVTDGNPPRGG
ncbi:hypothetical protein GCM10009609_29670 [Pseudonocardia aurantiaca]|uniref:WS/DGAT domain-containing protein n=1 Tax=Pseudonocardia aurantiaca TaxID=75290 RepID=A0ABW4FKA8_9PSEU